MDQKSEFYEKIDAPMPYPYIVKKLPFSKTHNSPTPHFINKTSFLIKYPVISCDFFKYLENPLVPIFGQR